MLSTAEAEYSTVTFRLDQPDAFSAFKAAFDREPRLQGIRNPNQNKNSLRSNHNMASFINILGISYHNRIFIWCNHWAMITMYAAVANRTVEVGTLRALGFRRRSILTAFLSESLVIAFIGGVVGLILGVSSSVFLNFDVKFRAHLQN